jgi:hypothetical protein
MKSKDTVCYQNILRAVGQAIEKLGIESFNLEISDKHDFVLSGTLSETKCACAFQARPTNSFPRLIINPAKNICRRKTRSTFFRFSGIRLTLSNVELLDRAGKASRWCLDGSSLNPLGIANVLRMSGAYLDSKSSRFLRLSFSYRHDTLTLWHFNRLGVEAKKVFTRQNLNDQWVHQFKTISLQNAEGVSLMHRYSTRICPRCSGHVGIIAREPA